MFRSSFNQNGLDIGKADRNFAYVYGLSDFWTQIFEDSDKIDLLLEADTQILTDIYSKFLQLCSTISIEDIQVATNQQLKLVLIADNDLVLGGTNKYNMPENILSSRIIANRPFLPTAYLEENVNYTISSDGTTIQFSSPLSSYGFPSRLKSDGYKEYALWFVDTLVDDQYISDYYANLVNVSPQTSTENYKNLIYGLFYLYTNGPNLITLRKGLNLALGIPLAREVETVLETRKYLDTDQWLVITDLNSYLIPYGLPPTVAVGDVLEETQELAQWVEVKDYVNDGNWWLNLQIPQDIMPHVPAGHTRFATAGSYADYLMQNFLKKHTFLVNVKTIDFKNLQSFTQLSGIIRSIKPTYTHAIYIWTVPTTDELLTITDKDPILRLDSTKVENLTNPVDKFRRQVTYYNEMGADKSANLTLNAPNTLISTSASVSAARAMYVLPTIAQGTPTEWYFEVTITADVSHAIAIGLMEPAALLTQAVGVSALGYGYTTATSPTPSFYKHNNVSTNYGNRYTTGDVIGVRYNGATTTLTFYKNGSTQGDISNVQEGLTPAISLAAVGDSVSFNFGLSPFTYYPAGMTNYGAYTEGKGIRRDTKMYTRSTVATPIYGLLGFSAQVNGPTRPFAGAPTTIDSYINAISQFRSNTRYETAWLKTFLTGQQDNFRVYSHTLNFGNNTTHGSTLGNSGISVRTFQQPDNTMRIIPLHITTNADIQTRFGTVGFTVPPLTTWTFTAFGGSGSAGAGIDAGGIDGAGVGIDYTPIILSNFSTLFNRGSSVEYLGPYVPKIGFTTYTPATSDLIAGDYFLFIRIMEDIVGAYWVTSNQSVKPTVLLESKATDGVAFSTTTSALSRGMGPNSSFYFVRGAGLKNVPGQNKEGIDAIGIDASGGSSTSASFVASSVTSVSTVATVNATTHGLSVDQQITVSGASPAAYNGTYLITSATINSFTYTFAGGTPPATGTITVTYPTFSVTYGDAYNNMQVIDRSGKILAIRRDNT